MQSIWLQEQRAGSAAGGELALTPRRGTRCFCLDRDAQVTEVFAGSGSGRGPWWGTHHPARRCAAAVALAVEAFGRPSNGLSHNAGIQLYGLGRGYARRDLERGHRREPDGRVQHGARAPSRDPQGDGARWCSPGRADPMPRRPTWRAYTAAKHGLYGLVQFHRGLGFFAPEVPNVRANLVAPGVGSGRRCWNGRCAVGRSGVGLGGCLDGMPFPWEGSRSQEVGGVILFLLSDRASFVTGESVRVDGGLLSIIPGTPREAG